jgi:hypothetical protein
MSKQTASPRLTPTFVEAVGAGFSGGEARQPNPQGQRDPLSGAPAIGGRVGHRGRRHRDGGHRRVVARRRRRPGRRRDPGRNPREVRRRCGVDCCRMQRHLRDAKAALARAQATLRRPPVRGVGQRVLVSVADKLHNAHAILRDYRAHGDELWQRFSVTGPQDHLWYYRSLLKVYAKRVDNWMVNELREVIDALEYAIDQST